jgi:ATP-binding cassette subfamily B protein
MGSAFRQLIDVGLKENYLQSINQSILYLGILILIFSVGSFFRSYFINNIAEKVINQIRKEAYNNIINFDIAHFEELKIGDIISRFSIDIELISKLIINFLSFFIRNSIMLVGGITLMFYQSPKLASITIITIPLLLLPLIQFGKYVRNISKNSLKLQANIMANVEETISNICAVQAFNQQENKIADFNRQISDYLKYSSIRLKIRSSFFAMAISVILLSITMVIWVGSKDIINGTLSSGQMMSFLYYAIIAGISSGGIFEMLSEIHSSIIASERVFALIDHTDKTDHNNTITSNYHNNNCKWLIEFNGVNFSYPSRLDMLVLNNLSFTINKGKFIGIIGKSGAGKTTIMQLLLKFYSLKNGIISINDQDISKTNTVKIRNLIAFVPQESSIFSGTIRSNIAFANPNSSEEDIIQAADSAGVLEFVAGFTEGLDTEIGEKGIRLSGGQKQRIALSRAILHKPEILLLDEAMSALDSESEQKVLYQLREIMKGKTILSIAHRISSIEKADEILVIDDGKLTSRDTHRILLEKCEVYKKICKEQSVN